MLQLLTIANTLLGLSSSLMSPGTIFAPFMRPRRVISAFFCSALYSSTFFDSPPRRVWPCLTILDSHTRSACCSSGGDNQMRSENENDAMRKDSPLLKLLLPRQWHHLQAPHASHSQARKFKLPSGFWFRSFTTCFFTCLRISYLNRHRSPQPIWNSNLLRSQSYP
ncbi:hypothetical protein FB446DRAFT_195642 [Lentinula raphanica]|nr:hypothetical protein FB446DRAFT_195642 [Lentinula raphanica]